MGCSAHIPSAQGRAQRPQLFAVAAGVSWGAPCAHKASMAPAAAPPPCRGCPRSLTCLVCFAVLGWSHHRPLGHLSPPTPSLLLLDQVGPCLPAVPCLPATPTPHEGASQRHCHRGCGVGCCRARSSPAPTFCNAAEPILATFWGQACPASSAGTHWDPHLLSYGIVLSPAHHKDRHPKPTGVTSALAPAAPSFGAGNEEEPKSPSPSQRCQCLFNSFPPRNILPMVLCCSLKPSAHPPLVPHRAGSIHQRTRALGGHNTERSEDVVR